MHHIQRKILSLLMHAPALRYAQLRPMGIESNHFAYHLEQLIRGGLIAKQDKDYLLTSEGLALADRISHGDIAVRKQPHIVTTICVTNDKGEIALFRHTFQPYLQLVGFPQGRLHYDEDIQSAAVRELFEKTGLQGISLIHRGMAYIHARKSGVDISRLMAHVFTGVVQGTPALSTAMPLKGKPFWSAVDDLDGSTCMPGFWEIKKLLDEPPGQLFFSGIQADM
ncbi:MAG TPA: NUDIX hydrolase [Candidatus Saccharimonadales bacterium]|nr:NUDIX hydrolase [Candidatus Saccharimonadales bacterium]